MIPVGGKGMGELGAPSVAGPWNDGCLGVPNHVPLPFDRRAESLAAPLAMMSGTGSAPRLRLV